VVSNLGALAERIGRAGVAVQPAREALAAALRDLARPQRLAELRAATQRPFPTITDAARRYRALYGASPTLAER
jgi:hypothetical protein